MYRHGKRVYILRYDIGLLFGESQDVFYTLLICSHALIFGEAPVKFNHGIKGSFGIGGQCEQFHFLSA